MSFVFTPIPSLFGPEDALALGQAAAVTSGHRPSGLPMVPSGLPLRRRRCVDVSLTPEIWQGSCNIVQHRATVSLSALSWLGVQWCAFWFGLSHSEEKRKNHQAHDNGPCPATWQKPMEWACRCTNRGAFIASTSSFIFGGQNTTDTRQMRPVKLCHHCSPLPAPYESLAVKLSNASRGSSMFKS